MEGTENYHIVNFDKYCPKCKEHEKPETDDTCWDCLQEGATLNGLPLNYKEAK